MLSYEQVILGLQEEQKSNPVVYANMTTDETIELARSLGFDLNFVVYHIHSMLSNGVTNIDSVTPFMDYVNEAQKCGMKAMAFSEHGCAFEWWHKKCAIEAAGMKYIHAVEAYITETLEEKVRDNYHCVLIARNYDGFLELNRLMSRSFCRTDNHFYYVPRISMDELFATSQNIIVTTACIGGVFGKGGSAVQQKMLSFMAANKERCFFEIAHHISSKQIYYNQMVFALSQKYGIRLIAGTDTHVLNKQHERGRLILQRAKGIHFEGEDEFDLKFHDYRGLIEEYNRQHSLDIRVVLEAIQNTNVLADMIEPFELDRGTKYPHIYENPEQTFRQKAMNAIENHPYALERHSKEELTERVEAELSVYEATKSIDFMLLETYMREWERKNGIYCGPGRGSVSGSMVAYLLGITQMDSLRFNLNFFRFMNPSRVTNADIDTDYAGKDRDKVKSFLLKDHMDLPQIRTAEIITFNTIKLKGAIRDVGRALEIPLSVVKDICAQCDNDEVPDSLRKKYPELFEYVDIVIGTIVSIGSHPSGVLVSDLNIDETVGLCTTGSSDYPISMINMKELDDLMYVKLDILGLDNVGVINDTCKMAGIDILTPDNVDLEDEAVWKSIRDDTTLIFQWESNSAQVFLKKFMSDQTIAIARKLVPNFSMIKWMSFGNGLLRPACASFRDNVARGEFYDNGFKELNDFLAMEAGRIAMQETIMQFLVKFCNYTDAESDNVRRAIAKKKGTETLIPEIKQRFIDYAPTRYPITAEECKTVIEPFIQVILDASAYAFSWNHSDSYSVIGYICGYLRYYYPTEFLTAALNIFEDNTDKTAEIIKYAKKVGVHITAPKFGISRREYAFSEDKKTIAKGLSSVKSIGSKLADELYEVSKSQDYPCFTDLMADMYTKAGIHSDQLDTLISIDFFSKYGNQREVQRIEEIFELFKRGLAKQIKKERIAGSVFETAVKKYATDKTKAGREAASYTLLDTMAIIRECEKIILTMELNDYGVVTKTKRFAEAMGYTGYVSGREDDRRKLFVRDIYALKRKRDGKQFGYSLITQSIGSGKESRFTVFNRVYQCDPVKKGDIIECTGYERDGQYFTMTGYRKLYDDEMEDIS